MRCAPLLAAVVGLVPPTAAQLQVWTVDDDGPADFASIQAAIDVAMEGDALLIRGGAYSSATVDGKRLTLLGGDGEAISTTSPLTIRNLAGGQVVTVVGLNVVNAIGFGYAAAVEDSAGTLWVQDCFLNAYGGISADGAYAVVRDSVLQGTTVLPGLSTFLFLKGDGITTQSSTLRLYGSALKGSLGENAGCIIGFSCGTAATGGFGLRLLSGSSAHLSGAVVEGGDGEASACDSTSWGLAGSGGDGIHVEAGSQALAIETSFVAGAAGISSTSCPSGSAGVAQSGAGSLAISPHVRRSLDVDDIVREGETITVTITSPANESVFVGTTTTPGELQDPLIEGPLILGSAPGVLPLGPMPASGSMVLSFPAPQLPPGVDVFVIYLQAAFAIAPGVGVAGDPMALVILDSAF